MKLTRLLLSVCALVLSVGLTANDAEAKRLGGGKSIGTQSSTAQSSTTARTADTPTAPTAAAAGQAPRKNSWLGPVAGLAAGLGLAALASHLGMGEEFANMLMIGLLVFAAIAVFRLLMRKRTQQPAMQYAGMGAGGGSIPMQSQAQPAYGSAAPATASASNVLPAGFDAEGFARQAKVNFIRLQAANDAGNLDDLREFVTPEIFAELQMQISERGTAPQQTEVMELNAEVVECVEENRRYRVAVRFRGLIREEAGAAPVNFDEFWHLTKPVDGNQGWQVAGIQQLN
ncbi:Tim44 domain-containing protein [Aromatoleum petrolei]|uniref:Tim44 domain-containing protein n=1 Tax=Aromatoleum petrolei TaxID=76116 RepID=A0ABX1MXA7_9RHOO|nr:Tim44-like domain-containing protein [Aromatoleum petrolei]NMF90734.1 Tim44 domain-containing protein [Aromatoleum petrolei]QTQ38399.1 Tim44-like domain-containing protein [Aromatoleum petrolei]